MSAPTDVLQAILADVSAQINALNLGPVVVVRKGPKKEPVVDAAQQFTVSMQSQGERKTYIAFSHLSTEWPIEVTYVAPSKRDYVSGFANDTLFRQQIEAIYAPPCTLATLFPTTPGIWEVRVNPDEMLPRGEIPEGIDRWTIVLAVKTAA